MSRKLASIQRIQDITPIPNANNLELAHVLGWKCVVLKGQFKPDDLVCYFEVDSFLPIKPEFEFLRKNCLKKTDFGEGFRIKTVRLRGQISQGLVMPLEVLEACPSNEIKLHELIGGEDVTERIGVKLYAPPIPECLKGLVKGSFPSFLLKTDETRVQVLQDVLKRHEGIKCYVSEKVDGTSVTYFVKDGEFGVCSRNLELQDSKCVYWDIAKELNIKEKLLSLNKNIAVQGEIFGTGIQCNPLKLDRKKVLFFNAFDIDHCQYYSYEEFKEVIERLGLSIVPIIEEDFQLTSDIDTLIKKSVRKSVINPSVYAEGIVIRLLVESFDLQMAAGFGNGRLSFKCVNPEYLLSNEE